ncbi:2,4-dihydroxyhept-2-ene-1,7-dioic acid aldolase [Halomonas citrativorans]|uniref:2,4-dihydroxyhept-2-ene-1,7-dioic acid aldolase n=1 Tax=Halomonas citrativorans TaxID=2742612 RepID=A0A1R4I3Z5_9GAMM|nr:aldolase/citrate lyase family protein [Halomonas citrativorans]SJN14498.1 2,4-dihydroxyhept-2-ene-1,7-dioic acid aldolase [Halomonas citrativorans]
MYLDKLLNLDHDVFGINVYSASPAIIEIAANWGLDFVFIDTEHSVTGIDSTAEKLILAARAANISPLVRVPSSNSVELRKTVEMGADGVIVPQISSASQVAKIIDAVKFPPLGKRGGDSSVRSAIYGSHNFNWADYTQKENQRCKVIPMAENIAFFDNIDDIFAIKGIDAIHFGPADFALSIGCEVDYSMKVPEIREAVELLAAKCKEYNVRIMLGCSPVSYFQLEELKLLGATMFLVGNDMAFINQGCSRSHELIQRLKEKNDG